MSDEEMVEKIRKKYERLSGLWVSVVVAYGNQLSQQPSLQGNQKSKENAKHPVEDYQRREQLLVSIDMKKKERAGNFKNNGRESRPKGNPEPVRVYDFVCKLLGKANS